MPGLDARASPARISTNPARERSPVPPRRQPSRAPSSPSSSPSASPFARALARDPVDEHNRRWLFVPYDQLTDRIGPLSRLSPREVGIVVVESPHKASLRPYHQHKLALLLTNLRHFCLEQKARGVAVRHVVSKGDYASALRPLAKELGPLEMMRPAERELRVDLAPLVQEGLLRELPHEGWLTSREVFDASHPDGPPFRMDRFYRQARKATGLLMRGDQPLGNKWSFDVENRERWRGEPAAPAVPTFAIDEITREVIDLVRTRYEKHPGAIDESHLPATAADARAVWEWGKRECLAWFGPFQDAMSKTAPSLFHTRLSPLLNLSRVLPRDVVDEAVELPIPLASKEGFVRQVLGWREYVHHVHEATDGFRTVTKGRSADGGASPSFCGSKRALPPVFWGKESGLACVDACVRDVWRTGYGHHITRLMVLSNLATLLDVSPREVTDWFWCAYADAFDWVVEPNVLGMGTFGVGELMTTKAYVAGSGYVERMGDFCSECRFDPKTDCPLRGLYWAWLGRKAERLAGVARMGQVLRGAEKRKAADRKQDAATFAWVSEVLERGEVLVPGGQQARSEKPAGNEKAPRSETPSPAPASPPRTRAKRRP